MKLLSFVSFSLIASNLFAVCPSLSGHYKKCHSEIKEMKGEYVIEQENINGIETYTVKYIDQNGAIEEDEFRTDGKNVSRKKKIPTVGVNVRVEGYAICSNNNVVDSVGNAFMLGAKVGAYNTSIYKTADDVLTMVIKAEYLGQTVNKLIQCKE